MIPDEYFSGGSIFDGVLWVAFQTMVDADGHHPVLPKN